MIQSWIIERDTPQWKEGKGGRMKLLQDLLGTDYGLMSISGIVFMIGMAIWFVRFFRRKIAETAPENRENQP